MKTLFGNNNTGDGRPLTSALWPLPAARRAGFTLMEVNIALLIMAVGLMGLLSLFPVGLRQGDAATSDTTEAAFADLVLNAMRANAQMVTNWSGADGWVMLTNGVNLGVAGCSPTTGGSEVFASGTATPIIANTTANNAIENYLVKGQHIEYVRGRRPPSAGRPPAPGAGCGSWRSGASRAGREVGAAWV